MLMHQKRTPPRSGLTPEPRVRGTAAHPGYRIPAKTCTPKVFNKASTRSIRGIPHAQMLFNAFSVNMKGAGTRPRRVCGCAATLGYGMKSLRDRGRMKFNCHRYSTSKYALEQCFFLFLTIVFPTREEETCGRHQAKDDVSVILPHRHGNLSGQQCGRLKVELTR